MTRYRYGGSADYIITLGTADAATLEPGASVTCWNAASGGTQHTDLVQTDGVTPIAGGVLTADAVGAVPEFYGPDGVASLYFDANAGSGPRRRAVPTDVGDSHNTLSTTVTSHTGAVNPHATTLAALSDHQASSTKGGGLLTYDAVTSKWRSDGSTQALMGWHADLADRHYSRANIVCIGDSITEGQGSTDFDNTWPARLRALLRARFPTRGVTGGGRGFIGALSTGSTSFTWPAVVTGGPGVNDDYGPKRYTPQLAADAPADTIAYAALQGTAVDIMWARLALGGNFRYRADGGSWTTVVTGGTDQDGQLTRVSLGASGAHSLDIEATTVGFQCFVPGIIEYDGDENAGITVHDCAHFGWDSSFWTSPISGASNWPASISALTPGLIVVMLGANDQFNSTAPATFQSNMVTLISSLRGAVNAPSPFPPIVLAMHGARGGTFTYPWPDYVDAAHAIADSDALVTVLDLTLGRRFPDYADSPNHGLYADTAHLSNRGNSYIADRLAAFIAPR